MSEEAEDVGRGMPWFRMYVDARTDAKLESLPDDQFRVWHRLLCYAAEGKGGERGAIPPTKPRLLAVEVAHGDEALLTATIASLAELDIVEATEDGGLRFMGWLERQYDHPSDLPHATRERQRRRRSRDVTTCHDPDSDSDRDSDSEKAVRTTVAPKKRDSDPRVKEFLIYYRERFRAVHNADALIQWAKHGRLVKSWLSVYDLEILQSCLDHFLKSNDPFARDSGWSLGAFGSRLQGLAARLRRSGDSGDKWERERAERDTFASGMPA